MTRPVLFVTNHAPGYRVPAFLALHAREGVEFALVGGEVRHGGGGGTGGAEAGLPARAVAEREVYGLAASGRYRAVVAGLSGRVALPAAHLGARRARVPFVLWATIWAHPRTPAHALSYLPLRHLYRDADAIATYGAHVSAYVRSKGARGPVVEAPQAVDNAFWGAPAEPDRRAGFQALFAGRRAPEKGLEVLEAAWAGSGLAEDRDAALVHAEGRTPTALRNFYAGSDVLVLPSVPTRDFLEPWGLVANEAMNQGLPVITTTAVGAAAGGLVRDGRTGLVVAPRDPAALAAALRRLRDDPALARRLGEAGREAVRAFTFEAWAEGMTRALDAAGVSRGAENGLLA